MSEKEQRICPVCNSNKFYKEGYFSKQKQINIKVLYCANCHHYQRISPYINDPNQKRTTCYYCGGHKSSLFQTNQFIACEKCIHQFQLEKKGKW